MRAMSAVDIVGIEAEKKEEDVGCPWSVLCVLRA